MEVVGRQRRRRAIEMGGHEPPDRERREPGEELRID
jgi:hypothetical protein